MTTSPPPPTPLLVTLALVIGEVEDSGGDAPAHLRSAVVVLGLSEEEQHLVTDVALVARGLLMGHDAAPGLVGVYGAARVSASISLALALLGAPDGPSPT